VNASTHNTVEPQPELVHGNNAIHDMPMTSNLLSIGLDEIIGASSTEAVASELDFSEVECSSPSLPKVAEAMAKLLKENQELTQDLEDNKEVTYSAAQYFSMPVIVPNTGGK